MRRLILAECVKMKRTLVLWLSFLVPLVVCGITCFTSVRAGMYIPGATDGWTTVFREPLGMWVVLVVPAFIALETALTSNIEKSNRTYRQMYCLPVPRWQVFVAKFIIVAAVIAWSHVLLLVSSVMSGLIIKFYRLRPDFVWTNFEGKFRTAALATISCFVLCLFMIAMYSYMSERWKNVLVVLGVGIMAPLFLMNLITSRVMVVILPWLLPFNSLWDYTADPSLLTLKPNLWIPHIVSVFCATIVLALGCKLVEEKDVF
jgi:lantibiotic transport system permease protein